MTKDNLLESPYFKKWYPRWIENAALNYPNITERENDGGCSVGNIKKVAATPAIVLGSGASLETARDCLKDWQGGLFAGPTNALIAKMYGREPDYICAYDALAGRSEILRSKWFTRSELITHPNVEPRVLSQWHRKAWLFRRTFDGHPYFDYILPLMFPMLEVGFRHRGNTSNNAIIAARYLGYSPIFMLGVDLGWKDPAKTRADYWSYDKSGKLIAVKAAAESDLDFEIVEDVNGARYPRHERDFKAHLLSMWVNGPLELYDCSDGRVTEFPKVDIRDVIRMKGRGFTFDRYGTAVRVLDSLENLGALRAGQDDTENVNDGDERKESNKDSAQRRKDSVSR